MRTPMLLSLALLLCSATNAQTNSAANLDAAALDSIAQRVIARERGKLQLDDDISKFIPEFPLQGHHVTVRQLLNHTSGIVDYHYLGDPIEATSRLPKALDEVMALYAGKNWVNEPGKKWDWSISGFQLLVMIVERVTGESFAD